MNRFDDMFKRSLHVLILYSVLINQRKKLSLLKYYLTWVPIKISLCKLFTWIKCCSLETNKDLPCFKMFTKSFNKRTCAGSNRSCCIPLKSFFFSLSFRSKFAQHIMKETSAHFFYRVLWKRNLRHIGLSCMQVHVWEHVWSPTTAVSNSHAAQFDLRWVGPVT